LAETLAQAAASGEDIEPILDRLREQLLQQAPDQAAEVDAMLDQLRAAGTTTDGGDDG
jgi:hypothetical protein